MRRIFSIRFNPFTMAAVSDIPHPLSRAQVPLFDTNSVPRSNHWQNDLLEPAIEPDCTRQHNQQRQNAARENSHATTVTCTSTRCRRKNCCTFHPGPANRQERLTRFVDRSAQEQHNAQRSDHPAQDRHPNRTRRNFEGVPTGGAHVLSRGISVLSPFDRLPR